MNKYFFLILFLIISLLTSLSIWWMKEDNLDILKEKTDFSIDAKQLTRWYLNEEANTDIHFKEKVIEVTGIIKIINYTNNTQSIILKGFNTDTNIICDFSSKQKKQIKTLHIGQQIKIKGICKGFLKDVIILNCILINN